MGWRRYKTCRRRRILLSGMQIKKLNMIVVVLYYWLLCTIGRIGRSLPLPLPWPLLLLLFLLDRCRCRCHCHCCCRCCYSYCTFTQWESRMKWFSFWNSVIEICVKKKLNVQCWMWVVKQFITSIIMILFYVRTTKYRTVRHTQCASVSDVWLSYGIPTFVHCLWSWNYFVNNTYCKYRTVLIPYGTPYTMCFSLRCMTIIRHSDVRSLFVELELFC